MDSLKVIADFNFLPAPQEVGILVHERIRGTSVFRFHFHPQWLEQHGNIYLCSDISNTRGWQFTSGHLFGCFEDALPDRWGRTLIELREQILANKNNRSIQFLTSFDYLCLLDDTSRMGGFRFKKEGLDSYINHDGTLTVPPTTSIQELCDATRKVEDYLFRGETPEEKWIRQLYNPGSSLGGARPKANVIGTDNALYIAKFPSRNDRIDVGLWEHFSHLLAMKAGITAATTDVMSTGNHHTLLSKRFDRDGLQRIHFASSMSLLGFSDGDGAQTDKGYLDIVDFIIGHCTNAQANLEELYRRVAFNICIGNTDDHFRNHGFLLTRQGWTLSPAYDINPTLGNHQALLINDESNESDLDLLLDSHKDYFITQEKAQKIVSNVLNAVRQWPTLAKKAGLKNNEIAMFQSRLDRWIP